MEHEFKFFVGIDWATQEHQVCVLDARRKVIDERVVKHTGDGIADLAARLAKLADPASVAVSIETARGGVIEVLVEHGFAVFHLNPKQLDRIRDRHTVADAKDDRRDAYVLADSLATDPHLFHRVHADEDDIIALRELVRVDDDLAKDLNGLTNRLREQLVRFFPQVLELSPSADDPWVWDLLTVIPNPAAAARASTKAVARVLAEHRIRRVDAVEVLTVLRQKPLGVSAGAVSAASAHIALLVPRLKLVTKQRRDVERSVRDLLATLAKEVPPEG